MNVLNYKKPLSTNQSSRIAKLIFLIILLLLMNCNTVWAYTKDRKNDFFDIVTIGFNIGIGVEAHIGPVPLGAGGFVGGGLSTGVRCTCGIRWAPQRRWRPSPSPVFH